ncbi:MAG: glycosyl transferase [Prevotella sp.]|nr:glycosyl transferase [Prevotella sp.]
MKKIFRILFDWVSSLLPDKVYLSLLFRRRMGYWMDWGNPRTFNEKLQWLKVYDRHSEYTQLVDKVGVKNYVAEKIGNSHIIPTLAVYNRVDEIDFDSLPDQFVMKCSHDSGGVVVCRDKSQLDRGNAIKILEKGLAESFYLQSREYPYKNVLRRIIVEKYIEDESGELVDYKFFCFDGVPKFLFVATDRMKKNTDTKFDFFDMEWNHLPLKNGHPNNPHTPQMPQNFDLMKEIATALSLGFPHVRVDLYNVKGKIYFGELTFFHWSGLVPFEPMEWDYKFGDMLTLPKL